MSETGWVRFRELEKVKDSVPRNERDRPVRVRACLHHDERERERERERVFGQTHEKYTS